MQQLYSGRQPFDAATDATEQQLGHSLGCHVRWVRIHAEHSRVINGNTHTHLSMCGSGCMWNRMRTNVRGISHEDHRPRLEIESLPLRLIRQFGIGVLPGLFEAQSIQLPISHGQMSNAFLQKK